MRYRIVKDGNHLYHFEEYKYHWNSPAGSEKMWVRHRIPFQTLENTQNYIEQLRNILEFDRASSKVTVVEEGIL